MGKIIAFGGRMSSGKYVLAEICESYGYERLYFALPLKKLVADLIRVDLDEINSLKNVEKDYKFTKMDYMFISNETGIPYDVVNERMSKIEFRTVRQLLQFIGTDLIRSYNINWHVNRIREMIDKDKKYVLDDMRFPNEMNMVKELGGDCWFIVRPQINEISNHISETSLRWQDFGNNIIVNDSNLARFRFRWETFFKDYNKSVNKREKYLKEGCIAEKYAEITEPLSTFELLELSIHLFKYKEREFDCEHIKSVSMDLENAVDIEYDDGSHEIVRNALNIEDLKFCL